MSLNCIFDRYGYVKLAPKTGDTPCKPRKRNAMTEAETIACLECPKKTCRGGVCKRLAEVRRRIQNNDSDV